MDDSSFLPHLNPKVRRCRKVNFEISVEDAFTGNPLGQFLVHENMPLSVCQTMLRIPPGSFGCLVKGLQEFTKAVKYKNVMLIVEASAVCFCLYATNIDKVPGYPYPCRGNRVPVFPC